MMAPEIKGEPPAESDQERIKAKRAATDTRGRP
jgi:hypothetical protein